MSEKFGPENVGSKYGEPLEDEGSFGKLNQEAIDRKKDEYIEKAFGVVWVNFKQSNPFEYDVLENNVKMERRAGEYNEVSGKSIEILDEMVSLIKKQIYIDTFESGGQKFPKGQNPREMSDFIKVVSEYSDDAIKKIVKDKITAQNRN